MTETMGRTEHGPPATPARVYARMPQDSGGDGGGSSPLQDHISAVLHHVRNVKRTVSGLQAQQAAPAAVSDPVAASDPDSLPPGHADLIAARHQTHIIEQPEVPVGLLTRQGMQQSSTKHSTQSGSSAGDSKNGSGAKTANAARLQALLQELATLSADGSSQCTKCRSQMALDLGELLLAVYHDCIQDQFHQY